MGLYNLCDPLTHDPLAYDYVNQISRTISVTFGIRPIEHATFFCVQPGLIKKELFNFSYV